MHLHPQIQIPNAFPGMGMEFIEITTNWSVVLKREAVIVAIAAVPTAKAVRNLYLLKI